MNSLDSREVEKMILGQIIMDNRVMIDVVDKIRPEYFSTITNELIYSIMLTMYEEKRPIDLITLIPELKPHGTPVEYIFSLPDNVCTVSNASYYAGMIKDSYVKRKILAHSNDIIEKIGSGKDTGDIVAEAIDLFLNINYSKDILSYFSTDLPIVK